MSSWWKGTETPVSLVIHSSTHTPPSTHTHTYTSRAGRQSCWRQSQTSGQGCSQNKTFTSLGLLLRV